MKSIKILLIVPVILSLPGLVSATTETKQPDKVMVTIKNKLETPIYYSTENLNLIEIKSGENKGIEMLKNPLLKGRDFPYGYLYLYSEERINKGIRSNPRIYFRTPKGDKEDYKPTGDHSSVTITVSPPVATIDYSN